jgi:hypothetical protein
MTDDEVRSGDGGSLRHETEWTGYLYDHAFGTTIWDARPGAGLSDFVAARREGPTFRDLFSEEMGEGRYQFRITIEAVPAPEENENVD